VCLKKKLIEKENRVCFKYRYLEESEYINIGIPETREDENGKETIEIVAEPCYNTDDVLTAVDKIRTMKAIPLWTRFQMKYIPVLEGNKQVKREICPVAFIDEEVSEWIMLEALCEKYQGAAVEMLKESKALLDPILPFVFMVIAETKNKYEQMKMKSKDKKK